MNGLLLDTHALLWWWTDHPSLTLLAREAISDPDTRVSASAASAWEIATKARLGRLGEFAEIVPQFGVLAAAEGFSHLPITYAHGLRAGGYETAHTDHFDRILAAQAEIESPTLVTTDTAFQEFPVSTLW